jgi:hypothetical protein
MIFYWAKEYMNIIDYSPTTFALNVLPLRAYHLTILGWCVLFLGDACSIVTQGYREMFCCENNRYCSWVRNSDTRHATASQISNYTCQAPLLQYQTICFVVLVRMKFKPLYLRQTSSIVMSYHVIDRQIVSLLWSMLRHMFIRWHIQSQLCTKCHRFDIFQVFLRAGRMITVRFRLRTTARCSTTARSA